jgi:ADP-ribose pyrophosphatase
VSRLEPATGRPYEVGASQELGRSGRHSLREDEISWPDGGHARYAVLETTPAVVTCPYFDDGTTLLVRQWRHAWDSSSWELPAGMVEPGEEPARAAVRELAEEAGLEASEWTLLGNLRSTALTTGMWHVYLARGLKSVGRAPEPYEADMITRVLPFEEALNEALEGGLVHAPSIATLCRAARHLRVI